MSLVGRLEDLDLSDILRIISLSRKSGILSLNDKENEAKIVFRNGLIVSASSTAEKDNIANSLVKDGTISLSLLKEAISHLRTIRFRRNLAWVLEERFGQDSETIESSIRGFVDRIVRSLFGWKEGFFNFELKETLEEIEKLSLNPLQPLLRKGLNPQQVMRGEGEPVSIGLKKNLSAIFSRAYADEEPLSKEGEEFLSAVRDEITRVMGEGTEVPRWGPEEDEETVSASPGLRLLRAMVEELNDPNRYTDVSLLVLRFASEIVNRAVLLMVRDKEIIGLGQFGIRLGDGANPERRVREIRIPVEEHSLFREVLDFKAPLRRKLRRANPWEEYFIRMLGGEQPEESFLGPLISRGKVVVILYGDNLPERRRIGDTTSLEIFLAQAGMTMEKAYLERRLREVPAIE